MTDTQDGQTDNESGFEANHESGRPMTATKKFTPEEV